MTTAAQIARTFAHAQREITHDQCVSIAGQLQTWGNVDTAVSAASAHFQWDAQGDMLAYRAALKEVADPQLIVARMKRQAADLDAQEEPLRIEAAEFWGKAAYRQRQGEEFLAAGFRKQAHAAERIADRWMLEAIKLRLGAASLEAELMSNSALMMVVA